MSDNKSFETMRDLVRLLQQAEYGLRTGTLSTDDVDKACESAREFYERLVVIRHKAREGRARDQVKAQEAPKAKAEAPVQAQEAPKPTGQQQEHVQEAPKAVAQELPKPEAKEQVQEVVKPKLQEPVSVAAIPKAQEQEAPKPLDKEPVPEAIAPTPIAATPDAPPAAAPPVKLETRPSDPRQTTLIEAIADKEKAPVTGTGPKTASDYLRDANATPSPAPEMAAIRAQQVVARPTPVLVSTTTLAEKMEKAHITDLAKSVSVSHKFWFTTELFNGDKASYESGIARLNSAKDLATAKALLETEILPKLKKPAHEEALNAIGELLQRRFE